MLEGVNGAGKSSLQTKILGHLYTKGLTPLGSREPGAGRFGGAIREILFSDSLKPQSYLAELFLFSADRAEHIHSIIKPALNNKQPVVLDRYFYSTLAFQGFGRKLPLDEVQSITDFAIQGMLPDLVLVLDLDPVTGLNRNKTGEKQDNDQFEKEALDFHTRLREGFLTVAENRKESFLVIDASKTPEEIEAIVMPVIDNWADALKKQWNIL